MQLLDNLKYTGKKIFLLYQFFLFREYFEKGRYHIYLQGRRRLIMIKSGSEGFEKLGLTTDRYKGTALIPKKISRLFYIKRRDGRGGNYTAFMLKNGRTLKAFDFNNNSTISKAPSVSKVDLIIEKYKAMRNFIPIVRHERLTSKIYTEEFVSGVFIDKLSSKELERHYWELFEQYYQYHNSVENHVKNVDLTDQYRLLLTKIKNFNNNSNLFERFSSEIDTSLEIIGTMEVIYSHRDLTFPNILIDDYNKVNIFDIGDGEYHKAPFLYDIGKLLIFTANFPNSNFLINNLIKGVYDKRLSKYLGVSESKCVPCFILISSILICLPNFTFNFNKPKEALDGITPRRFFNNKLMKSYLSHHSEMKG